MLGIIGKIEIDNDAVINEYEHCSTNAYVVFKKNADYTPSNIVCAYYDDSVQFGELMEEYPYGEFTILHADISVDLFTDKQTIDLYLS